MRRNSLTIPKTYPEQVLQGYVRLLLAEVDRLQEALERERGYEPMKDCGVREAR